jgi:hypothetical protein
MNECLSGRVRIGVHYLGGRTRFGLPEEFLPKGKSHVPTNPPQVPFLNSISQLPSHSMTRSALVESDLLHKTTMILSLQLKCKGLGVYGEMTAG